MQISNSSQSGLNIELNTISRDEHVGKIECFHRVIKERSRATLHDTPFKRIPKIMNIKLNQRSVYYLNEFP